MTISTIRTTRGKLIHVTKGNVIPVSNGGTGMAEVLCGKELTGITGEIENPDDVTCHRCHDALLAELAAELAEVEAQMAMYGEPTVLSSAEAVTEHEPSRMTLGRYRHGMIQSARSERRRQMKLLVRKMDDSESEARKEAMNSGRHPAGKRRSII